LTAKKLMHFAALCLTDNATASPCRGLAGDLSPIQFNQLKENHATQFR